MGIVAGLMEVERNIRFAKVEVEKAILAWRKNRSVPYREYLEDGERLLHLLREIEDMIIYSGEVTKGFKLREKCYEGGGKC